MTDIDIVDELRGFASGSESAQARAGRPELEPGADRRERRGELARYLGPGVPGSVSRAGGLGAELACPAL